MDWDLGLMYGAVFVPLVFEKKKKKAKQKENWQLQHTRSLSMSKMWLGGHFWSINDLLETFLIFCKKSLLYNYHIWNIFSQVKILRFLRVQSVKTHVCSTMSSHHFSHRHRHRRQQVKLKLFSLLCICVSGMSWCLTVTAQSYLLRPESPSD